MQRGRERYGEIFSFRLLGRRVAVLTGPKANEAFFRADGDVLSAKAAYRFKGDELYVRATVASDRRPAVPYGKNDVEMAWTQPVAVRRIGR